MNASAYEQLAPFARAVGIGLTMAIAGAGWFMRRSGGWFLAVVFIAVQVAGDVVNTFMGQYVRGQ